MKKKTFFLISGVVVLFIIIFALIVNTLNKDKGISYREELDNNHKKIIAEKAYVNYAWGYDYRGMAIFNDGTIYKWNFDKIIQGYKVNDYDDHNKLILEYGSKEEKRVPDNDLKKIEKLISNIEDNIDSKNTAYDAGSKYTAIWNNKGNKIKLIEKGDYTGENKSDEAKRLISIIDKYLYVD